MDAVLLKISGHNHTGSGNGGQLGASALQSNSVTGAKIRLANAEWLRARNAAGTNDVNMIRVNSSDVMELASSLAGLQLNFDLSFGSSGTYKIGNNSTPNLASEVNTLSVWSKAAALTLGTKSTHSIDFKLNDTTRWSFNSDGELVPAADAARSIGSATVRLAGLYTALVSSGSNGASVLDLSSALAINCNVAGSTRWQLNSNGNLTGDATNGGSIVFQKAGEGITYGSVTLKASELTPTAWSTGGSDSYARYIRIGKITFVSLYTTLLGAGGVGNDSYREFALPFASRNNGNSQSLPAVVNIGGANTHGTVMMLSNSTTARAFFQDDTPIPKTSDLQVWLNAFYETA